MSNRWTSDVVDDAQATAAGQQPLLVRNRGLGTLGIFPDRMQDSIDGDMMMGWLYRMQPAELRRVQQAMWMAGMYGDEAIINRTMPRWGQVDQNTLDAWQGLVNQAYLYQANENPKSLEELLDERLQATRAPGGIHEQAAGVMTQASHAEIADRMVDLPDEQVTLTDEASVRDHLRRESVALMGRELSDEEMGVLTSVVLSEERRVLRSAAEQRIATISGEKIGAAHAAIAADRAAAQRAYEQEMAALGLTDGIGVSGQAGISYLDKETLVGGGPNSNSLAFLHEVANRYGLTVAKGFDAKDVRYNSGTAVQLVGPPELVRKAEQELGATTGPNETFGVVARSQVGASDGLYVRVNEGARRPPSPAQTMSTGLDPSSSFLRAVRKDSMGPDAYEWGKGSHRGAYRMNPRTYAAVAREIGLDPDGEDGTSPEAQDRVARHMVDRLWNKYGDWNKVAQAWVGGEDYADRVNVLNPRIRTQVDRPASMILNRMSQATRGELRDPDALIGFDGYGNANASTRPPLTMSGGQVITHGGNIFEQTNYDTAARAEEEFRKAHANEIVANRSVMTWDALGEALHRRL